MDDSIRNEIEAKHKAAMQALIEEKQAKFIEMRAAHQAQKEAIEEDHSKTLAVVNNRNSALLVNIGRLESEIAAASKNANLQEAAKADLVEAKSDIIKLSAAHTEALKAMFTKDQVEALVAENKSALATIKDLQTQVTNAKAAALDAENRSKLAIEQAASKLEQSRIVMDNRIAKCEQDAAAKVADLEKRMAEMASHPDVRKAKIKSLKDQLATLNAG